MLQAPSTSHYDRPGRACWHCRWFAGMHYHDLYALCSNPGCSQSRAAPEHGCCLWEREPGADDAEHPPPSADSWRREWAARAS